MDVYVCLIMSRDRQILTVAALPAETDAEARQRAHELTSATEHATNFELWLKGHKITQATLRAEDGKVA